MESAREAFLSLYRKLIQSVTLMSGRVHFCLPFRLDSCCLAELKAAGWNIRLCVADQTYVIRVPKGHFLIPFSLPFPLILNDNTKQSFG